MYQSPVRALIVVLIATIFLLSPPWIARTQNKVSVSNFTGQVTGVKTIRVVHYDLDSVGNFRVAFDDQFAYLATTDGLFRTSRDLNPNSPLTLIGFAGQQIHNLYIHNNVLYVLKEGKETNLNTVEAHSFLKSTDHGQTFVPLDGDLTYCIKGQCWYLFASQLFFRDNLMFLSAGGGSNFFVSQDEGKTWKTLMGFREPVFCSISPFAMIGNKVLWGGECPLDFAFLSVGTLQSDMLAWSDTGQPRQVMGLDQLQNRNVQFILHEPNTSFVIAGVEAGILRSNDLGETYQFKLKYSQGDLKTPYVQHFQMPTRYRDLVVAAGFNKAGVTGYLTYSPDQGETWIDISDFILPPNYTTAGVGFLTEDPQSRLLAGLINSAAHELIIAEVIISAPVTLLTENDGERLLALDSVTSVRDPLSPFNLHNFSSDQRTRVSLFFTNLLPADENASAITVQAEDSAHKLHQLPVEFVGTTPNYSWLKQIVVRLPETLAGAGDVRVSIVIRGVESNKAVLNLK